MNNTYERRPETPRFRLRSASDEWFQSLTPGNQEVIRWFADTFGRGLAKPRGILVTDFYRLHAPPTPGIQIPFADKYEFCFDHFESFKQYCHERMVPNDGEEVA